MKSNRVALYLRVSTTHQNTELQERDLKQFCEYKNLNITHIYKETCSGSKQSRPELKKLMNDARKRKFDIVLCWKFDRYSRSTKHLVESLEEFDELGIAFISYQENLDTSSSMGRAMFSIISAIAQLERDLIRERVISGLNNAREKGRKLGRLKKRSDQKIRLLRSKGLSYRAIAKELSISVSSVQAALKGLSKS
ncbi:MAG: recombinase family protein [Bacteriovoracaceae bacterium]